MAPYEPTRAWAAVLDPLNFRPIRIGFQTHSTVAYHGDGPHLLTCVHDLTVPSTLRLIGQLRFGVSLVTTTTHTDGDTLVLPRTLPPSPSDTAPER
ncbi:hypothetical protein LO772_17615 [Yinghuangia sp. ASG 101]|uniref:hypothetical protein n=1 Tax=Yinghuangia sp. ASG 101 TaxID=2896848 RepID=UPI001E3A60DE|nr:hypothetical protein [Yinghuangia sp. ASG 101]UGQ15218.1 hypothetical protein LO772_17615 [Yinghuangia sp. ASG 101]